MFRRTPAPILLGWAWLACAACLTVVYRGATQSFTTDESFVYHLFIDQKAATLFQNYDAAYHVLQTWLTWRVVHSFGRSEIFNRVPSMLAGLAYLAGTGVLCRRLLGDGWKFLAGVVLLSAHPLIGDYLSMARGYGGALAFYVWAFDALLCRRPVRAGVLLGFSVACNLTFLFPAVAAGSVYFLHEIFQGVPALPLLGRLGGSFLAVAVPILEIPLSHADASNYYFGARRGMESINTLIEPSVAYKFVTRPIWLDSVEHILFPILLLAALAMGLAAARRGNFPALLATGSLAVSILMVVGAHAMWGTLYPWSRTGLYFIWLFLASYLTLWEWTATETGAWRRLAAPYAAAVVVMSAVFLSQFQTRYYYEFRGDADLKAIMQRLRDSHGEGRACIGGNFTFESTVNYYRLLYRMQWLDPMIRTDVPERGCDYYLLLRWEADYVERLHLTRLWTGPASGTILAQATD